MMPSVGTIPSWLQDANIRDGIRAMHKGDRCNEEIKRLDHKALNITRFLCRELAAIELAIKDPESEWIRSNSLAFLITDSNHDSDASLLVLLTQRYEQLLLYKTKWLKATASSTSSKQPITTSDGRCDNIDDDDVDQDGEDEWCDEDIDTEGAIISDILTQSDDLCNEPNDELIQESSPSTTASVPPSHDFCDETHEGLTHESSLAAIASMPSSHLPKVYLIWRMPVSGFPAI